MNIYKRGRVWWVEYVVDGERHRRSCHTRQKAAAEEWVRNIGVARQMPTFEEAVEVLRMLFRKRPEKGLPLAAAWERYWDLAKSVGRDKVTPTTERKRRGNLRQFIEWAATEAATVHTVEAVTPPVAAAYAAHLARSGKKSKTRKNALGDLSTIWKLLVKTSTELRNPWTNLAPIDDDSVRGKAFAPDEQERVLEAAARVGKEWYPVVVFALHTGLRYGDVATLRWDNVDGDVLRVTPRKTQRHRIAVAFPIIEPLKKILETLPRRGDFLFPLHAESYSASATSHKKALPFAEVLQAAGLDGQGFTFHSLRHTAATNLAVAGVDIETRKRILGHTEDTTAERYDHDEHLGEIREAMEKVNRGRT